MTLRLRIAAICLAAICTLCSLLAEERGLGDNAPRLSVFSFEGKSMRKATRELSKEFKTRVCFEESQVFPKTATKEQAEALRWKENLGVSVTVTNSTLEEILKARCASDSLYAWEQDKDNNTINIHPRTNAPLDWKIQNVSFTNITLLDVFEKDLLTLGAHDVNLDMQFGKHGWLATKVSLSETNVCARVVLNRLFSQVDPAMRWEVWSRHIAPGRVDHALWCHPVGKE